MKKIEKRNVKEIKKRIEKMENGKLHECSAFSLDIRWDDYRILYGGAVFDCNEFDDGRLFVDNGEYGNRVNYCPFCGYKAKMQMKLKKDVGKSVVG